MSVCNFGKNLCIPARILSLDFYGAKDSNDCKRFTELLAVSHRYRSLYGKITYKCTHVWYDNISRNITILVFSIKFCDEESIDIFFSYSCFLLVYDYVIIIRTCTRLDFLREGARSFPFDDTNICV